MSPDTISIRWQVSTLSQVQTASEKAHKCTHRPRRSRSKVHFCGQKESTVPLGTQAQRLRRQKPQEGLHCRGLPSSQPPSYRRRLRSLPALLRPQFYLRDLTSQDTCHAAPWCLYLWINTQAIFVHRTGPVTGAQGHTQLANPRAKPIQTQVSLTQHLCSGERGFVKVGRSAIGDGSVLVANQPYVSCVSLGSQFNLSELKCPPQ